MSPGFVRMLSANDLLRLSGDELPESLLLIIEFLGELRSACLSEGAWDAMKDRRNRLALSLGPASFSTMGDDLLRVRFRRR